MLRQNGLALGGSLDNAIVLGETGVLNNALRFEDEFVRHKILDAIGDLALVGYPVIGHLVAHRAGHALHTEFAAKILEETDAWRLVEAPSDGRAMPVGVPVKRRAAARELVRSRTVAECQLSRQYRNRTASTGRLATQPSTSPAASCVVVCEPQRFEPVDPFADQIELQRVAARLLAAPGSSIGDVARVARRRASAAARRARSRG